MKQLFISSFALLTVACGADEGKIDDKELNLNKPIPSVETATEAEGIPETGVLSFSVDSFTNDCTTQSGQGLNAEYEYKIDDGMITISATDRQLSQALEKVDASDKEIISSTAFTGFIQDDGKFTATAEIVMEDRNLGFLYYTYSLDGELDAYGWLGEMQMRGIAELDMTVCTFVGNWKGSRK